ncbi:MAG: FAD-binding domain-containing protein [Spirochaetaceae bacterium]
MRVLWWIKRDLRLTDNLALTEACAVAAKEGGEVVPLYILEPSLIDSSETGAHHLKLILQGLTALRARLREKESDLLLLLSEVPDAFDKLMGHAPFDAIHVEEETGTRLTYDRDRRLRRWCAHRGVTLREYPRNGVVRGLEDRDRRIDVWRERIESPPLPEPPRIPTSGETKKTAAATPLPSLGELGFEPPGNGVQRLDEGAGERTLTSFLEQRAKEYTNGISSPSRSRFTGSRLSVHLAWGTLSLRQAMARLRERERELRSPKGERGWLKPLSAFASRLHWHDHFIQRLEDEPEMEVRPLNRAYEDMPYENDPDLEAALWAGRTGFPMVDASVRSLRETGFVNFRMRAMIVSFATYALHLDWRRLLHPMGRIMADYHPGIHIAQLQMQAGVVGINTVRVYNPTKQLLDHDGECTFVRRCIPELGEWSNEEIITHALAGVDSPSHRRSSPQGELFSSQERARGGREGGEGYPPPIVAFRERVKSMQGEVYRRKGSAFGRAEAARVLEKHGSRRRGR